MENFQIHTDISLLPANEHEAYLKEGFNGICTGGGAVIQLFSVRYRISEGELITIYHNNWFLLVKSVMIFP